MATGRPRCASRPMASRNRSCFPPRHRIGHRDRSLADRRLAPAHLDELEKCVRPALDENHPVHVVLRAKSGLPGFRQQRIFGAIRKRIAAAERDGFQIIHFSVQENHIHFVVEAMDRKLLWRGVQRLAMLLAFTINRLLRRHGSVWRDRYTRRDLSSTVPSRYLGHGSREPAGSAMVWCYQTSVQPDLAAGASLRTPASSRPGYRAASDVCRERTRDALPRMWARAVFATVGRRRREPIMGYLRLLRDRIRIRGFLAGRCKGSSIGLAGAGNAMVPCEPSTGGLGRQRTAR